MTVPPEVTGSIAPSVSRIRVLMLNSSANLVRAVSASAVSVLLPLLLLAFLPTELYSAWILVFGLGAFVTYLDLGIPTSIQALVGRSDEHRGSAEARSATLSGITLTITLTVLCAIAAIAVAANVAAVFPDIPDDLRAPVRLALPILVIGQGLNLVGNAISAYFAGRQLSHVPMWILSPARILSMLLAVAAAVATQSIPLIAVAYTAPLLLAVLVMVAHFWRHSRARPNDGADQPRRISPLAVLRYSGPLILWNVCMLVVSGFGIVIVARVDYDAVAVYSVCLIAIAAIASLAASVSAPLLPELARLWAARRVDDFSRLITVALGLNSAVLFYVTSGILAVAACIMPLIERGHGTPIITWTILVLLGAANATRLAMSPLSLAFIATQTHSKIILPPVIEAATNLGFSVLFGWFWGAAGVASGYFIGSVVGMAVTVFWSVRATGVFTVSGASILRAAVLTPATILLPPLIIGTTTVALGVGPTWSIVGAVVSIALSSLLAWFLGVRSVFARVLGSLRRR